MASRLLTGVASLLAAATAGLLVWVMTHREAGLTFVVLAIVTGIAAAVTVAFGSILAQPKSRGHLRGAGRAADRTPQSE